MFYYIPSGRLHASCRSVIQDQQAAELLRKAIAIEAYEAAALGNRPVILPISGRSSRSIIAGTHIMGDAFVANMSSGALAVMSFTSR